MNVLKGSVLVLVAFAGLTVSAQAAHGYRQYYSPRYAAQGYSYRYHYYKPYPSYSGYKYHMAVYYPSRPRYVYYYNPYKKMYWGRYDLVSRGYSTLAEENQRGLLNDIPESAFPPPGPMPTVREATDGTPMLPPPENLAPQQNPPGGNPMPFPSPPGSGCKRQ